MMFGYGYGGGWPFWEAGLLWLAMIAFCALVVWALYTLVAGFARRWSDPRGGDEARRILDERLARGDIDAEEYRRVRDLLQSDAPRRGSAGGRRAAR